ncbi:MAG: RiPP maturation radical SAM protein 1 [Chromatiales bacterium]|nr:RiPP maturation radical SAM protein 1 [Chromatiales bacterium]
MSDVCLVCMPFVALERPSLALGLLQASARAAGVATRTLYPAFELAPDIGVELYSRILHSASDLHLGDWLFAGVAFPDEHRRHAGFLEQIDRRQVADWLRVAPDDLDATLWRARELATALTHRTARRIVDSAARIVGCSSVFEQQVASLALLRAVKTCDPTVITMLGGANCEAEMGHAAHRAFEWLDFVVSGEADAFFGDFCADLLHRGADQRGAMALPPGTHAPTHRNRADQPPVEAIGRASVSDLDHAPIPEYQDYFDALAASPLRDEILPALLVETSRGCWWGEKHHCTFCGLNGDEMAYRPKSAQRVLSELATLVERYGTHRLLVVDNILHRKHLDSVMPALADAGAPYSLFYETKANLTRAQIALLSRAGVRRVQPGFESLHRGALELFDKGTTPVINLQFLRSARTLGTFVTWNFLWQVPGEDWSWYASIADWIPLVTHLQPPNTLCPVRIDRFSLYHRNPDDYGLELRPTPGLHHVYPVDAQTLEQLAYYFVDVSRPLERTLHRLDLGNRRMMLEVDKWMRLWDRVRRADDGAPEVPRLEMRPGEGVVEVVDSRPVATAPHIELRGLDAAILVACDGAPSRASLARRLDAGASSASAIDASVARLVERKLLLELDDRLVALPTEPQQRPYIPVEDYPGGYFAASQRAHEPPPRQPDASEGSRATKRDQPH